ncbi:acyltransferase family protein [Clostridium estertheticum]|uniref:Acyltransferase 3 domain-containing protein n=1 Tax=Clostridium estertheticum subsp. estertheticum TaxID=1552 RepID=A0A1J0GJR0_9CLOT|nr:acyltransferase family protein [Clostridium estertheticum]APC41519.1 hypothetical protein A7L45_16260 [Clostridium estertheticum subsp. estertheticum]
MKKRNETLDILKGIAILSVILGHAVQRGLVYNFDSTIIWRVVYSYHMPLFVLLSGFTLYLSNPTYNFEWVKRKFYRLIVPLISWTLLVELMCNFQFTGLKPFTIFPNSFYEFAKKSILHPDWAFWFLWIIFIFMLTFYFIDKITKKYNSIRQYQMIFLIFIVILVFKVFNLPQGYFGVADVLNYFPIFICGYYLSKYKDYIFKYVKYTLLPSALLWIVLLNKWDSNDSIAHKYIMAIVAMITVYCLVKLLEKQLKWLTYFGKRSLELYVCESIFLNIGISSGYIRVISIFITATICSLLFARILKTNKYTNFIAFGSFKSENKFRIKKIVTST